MYGMWVSRKLVEYLNCNRAGHPASAEDFIEMIMHGALDIELIEESDDHTFILQ
jgi:hypothetical protein